MYLLLVALLSFTVDIAVVARVAVTLASATWAIAGIAVASCANRFRSCSHTLKLSL